MKCEPIGDRAERKRLLALIERCEKEQTMSDDLIRRSDALKVLSLYGWTPIDGLYDTLAHDIPSADRPQEWIPCSERVPRGSDGISECEMVLMTLSVGYVACGWINGDTAYVLINNPTYDQIVIADIKEVIAWMPLPKPWKGADDERTRLQ